jgi:ATP-dependent protease ClpP protease subunit
MTTGSTGKPPTTYVSFSAEITPQTSESLIAVMADCATKHVQDVYLMLSTLGGQVVAGMNLYNVLRGMPFKITTHNVGSVNSIGNVIFLAGTERYACPHSTFMFHGVGFDVSAGARLEERSLREKLDGILSDQKRIGAIIAEHTNLSPRAIADLFRRAQTKDAAYAVGCGIVHQVKDIQIPAGNPVISLAFKRQGV